MLAFLQRVCKNSFLSELPTNFTPRTLLECPCSLLRHALYVFPPLTNRPSLRQVTPWCGGGIFFFRFLFLSIHGKSFFPSEISFPYKSSSSPSRFFYDPVQARLFRTASSSGGTGPSVFFSSETPPFPDYSRSPQFPGACFSLGLSSI